MWVSACVSRQAPDAVAAGCVLRLFRRRRNSGPDRVQIDVNAARQQGRFIEQDL
jgi:hypothetical protein